MYEEIKAVNKSLRTAIIMLSFEDFESLEISLAVHTKMMPKNASFFILQNGRGTYNSERCLEVIKRYYKLFPKNIIVVDWISPKAPYFAIRELINNEIMEEYDYICKLDDDVFPLTNSWLSDLQQCYENSYNVYKEKLGYVTPLVNNNPYGFLKTLEIMGLKQEYFDKYARDHEAGVINSTDITVPYRFVSKDTIYTGGCGTIWGNAYISRWLHSKTTLNPDLYIQKSILNKIEEEVDTQNRYSINCIFFKKSFWNNISDGSDDDERMCTLYCQEYDKKIISCLYVPVVHLFFYTQRNENKDLISIIRDYYQKWLDCPFPIGLCSDKSQENERRIQSVETKLIDIETKLKNLQSVEYYKNSFNTN